MLLDELGVKKIINAHGTITLLGGTIIDDEVIDAMREVSKIYLDIKDLHKNAGRYIANLLGVESACVVAGATAGLILSAASCITMGDKDKIIALPKTKYKRNKIIVQRLHRNAFLNSLPIAGAEVLEIGNDKKTKSEDLENAIDETTAAVMYFAFDPQEGVLSLDQVLKISHNKEIPVILDAAAELPPVDNLQRFTRMGTDLVVFSGGKAIGAPNDTGLVLGRRDLIETCMRLEYYEMFGSETVALLGRPMKTSKEDILALTVALKRYVERDHDEEMRNWEAKVDFIVSELSKTDLPKVHKVYPKFGHGPRPLNIPRAAIDFSESLNSTKAEEIAKNLISGNQPISVYVKDNILFINPQCLQDHEEKIVVERLTTLSK